METPLKQRLIGLAVLSAIVIVFLPMLLDGPDVKDPDAAQVPLDLPKAPDDSFETRELALGAPQDKAPAGGVLGMDTAPRVPVAAAPDAVATPETPAPTPAGTAPAVEPVAPAPTPAPVAATPTAPAPAPVPTPPVVPPAAVAAGNYALNVGTYTNTDNANALVARLRAAKLPVTSEAVKLNGGAAVRVRVGPYVERAAAEAARLRTDAVAGGSSRVIALDGRALAPAPTAASAMPTTLPKPVATAPTPTPKPAAPAPAAPKPATPAPATASSGFAVQLAAPAEEAAALGLRDRARAAGFIAFVQRVDTAEGARFRVRLGPTADRAAADALRTSASQKLGISGNVVSHP